MSFNDYGFVFSFSIWNALFQALLMFKVLIEKSAVILMGLSLFVCALYFFFSFSFHYTLCILSVLTIMCRAYFLFKFCLFCVLCGYWIRIGLVLIWGRFYFTSQPHLFLFPVLTSPPPISPCIPPLIHSSNSVKKGADLPWV